MQNDKLLPCPFCGGEAIKVPFTWACISDECTIECTMCGARTTVLHEEDAIKQWNTRKPMERIVEQLENHKNCYEKVIGQVIVDNYDINLERVDLMNCAIDIVRKGGVDNG